MAFLLMQDLCPNCGQCTSFQCTDQELTLINDGDRKLLASICPGCIKTGNIGNAETPWPFIFCFSLIAIAFLTLIAVCINNHFNLL